MAEKESSFPRKALQARKRAKHKKPEFLRSESWRYTKLSESWRRPRGLDHKMRRKIKGWPPMVSTGYKGPKIARGLHPSGYREVLVHNVQEVSEVDPKTQVARIAHTVGKKKRALIIAEAREKKITVLNAKEVKEAEEEGEETAEEAEEKPEEQTVEEAEKEKKVEKPKRKSEVKKAAKKPKSAETEEEPKAKRRGLSLRRKKEQ
jgi:large subunit ribosomal protein L32e